MNCEESALQVRVCIGDPSIEFTSQSEAFEDIQKYEDGILGIQTGPLLAVLCSLMWLITGAHVHKHVHEHTNARVHVCTQSLTKWQVASG